MQVRTQCIFVSGPRVLLSSSLPLCASPLSLSPPLFQMQPRYIAAAAAAALAHVRVPSCDLQSEVLLEGGTGLRLDHGRRRQLHLGRFHEVRAVALEVTEVRSLVVVVVVVLSLLLFVHVCGERGSEPVVKREEEGENDHRNREDQLGAGENKSNASFKPRLSAVGRQIKR